MEELKIADIERLAKLVGPNGLAALEVTCGDTHIALHAHTASVAAPAAAQMPVQTPVAAPVQVQEQTPAEVAGTIVTAPLVGTYYSAASPESEPFVQIGQHVKKGDVLMLIESMKLMNEVLCETDGVVAEIYVQNGCPVEYGQKLLRIC